MIDAMRMMEVTQAAERDAKKMVAKIAAEYIRSLRLVQLGLAVHATPEEVWANLPPDAEQKIIDQFGGV